MAESCSSADRNKFSNQLNVNRDLHVIELPKQDCASPSPTETVVLDSINVSRKYFSRFFTL